MRKPTTKKYFNLTLTWKYFHPRFYYNMRMHDISQFLLHFIFDNCLPSSANNLSRWNKYETSRHRRSCMMNIWTNLILFLTFWVLNCVLRAASCSELKLSEDFDIIPSPEDIAYVNVRYCDWQFALRNVFFMICDIIIALDEIERRSITYYWWKFMETAIDSFKRVIYENVSYYIISQPRKPLSPRSTTMKMVNLHITAIA